MSKLRRIFTVTDILDDVVSTQKVIVDKFFSDLFSEKIDKRSDGVYCKRGWNRIVFKIDNNTLYVNNETYWELISLINCDHNDFTVDFTFLFDIYIPKYTKFIFNKVELM